jgi:kynurenine formamidase
VQQAAQLAGGVRPGDIVLLRFDWDARNAAIGGYPAYPEPAALDWLIEQEIKLLGIDSPGLEVEGDRSLPNHQRLFARQIPLIESLAGLNQLSAKRTWIWAVPPPIYGTDAVPLRVLAFEPLEATEDAPPP